MSPSGREGRLGPALLVALLVAALATGVLVYHARTPDLALEVPEENFDRQLGTRGEAELPVEIQFFVRFDEPHARVEIVGSEDATVRTFAADVPLAEDERISCQWDGRDDDGDPVPPGNYRLRVVLPGQDRDMVFPLRILVRQPGGEAGSVADPPNPEDSAVSESATLELADGSCERVVTGEALE